MLIAVLFFLSFSFVLANEEQKQIDVLLSEAALFEKTKACHRLTIIGTGKSVDTLSSLLCDESLGDYARYAMEGIDDPSVDQAFRKALNKCQGKMRIGIVNSIGVRRDAKATGQLSKLALDPDSGASAEALAALGRIATGDAINTIQKALKSNSQTLRLAAGDATLTAAERLLVMDKQTHALKLYVAIGKADVPKNQRTAALYSEIMARGSKGLPLLTRQLKNDDPAMVAVALRAARDMDGTKVTKKLAKELRKLPANVQVLLIKVLVDRNDPTAVKGIQTLVSSKNPDVVAESLKALGRIGDVSTAPILLKAACADSKQAAIALVSLRMLKGEGVDKAIVAQMKKTTPAAKAKLIGVLSDRGAVVGLDEIFDATKDKDTKVQRAAFKAIAKLAPAEDIDRVLVLLENIDDDVVRKEAERAVISVARKIPEKSKRADTIIAAYKREKNIQARSSFIRILVAFADDKSFQVIKSAVDDENEQIEDAAVRAITAWPNTQAMNTLLAIFKETGNKTHRILALRGYVRLLKQDKQTNAAKKAEILGQIIEQVDTVAEKKNILSALASLQDPSALGIARKYISDPQVRDEAMLAAIQIGKSIPGTKIDSLHQEQFTSLFDGKTFTGWEGNLNWFRIEDAAIVAGNLDENLPHNFFLATTKEYYNFELRLKVRTSSPNVNGGIQFRSKRIPDHHEVKGYQADLGQQYWGGLYDESRRNKFLAPLKDVQDILKKNDWNDYRIRCVNDRIQLFLNGIKTVDYVETDPAIAKQPGIIAIQIHGGPPAEAWYKDIMIKEL